MQFVLANIARDCVLLQYRPIDCLLCCLSDDVELSAETFAWSCSHPVHTTSVFNVYSRHLSFQSTSLRLFTAFMRYINWRIACLLTNVNHSTWCVVVHHVNQLFDRLPQQLIDRVLMRSFTSIFSSHYKTTALRAGELTVNTLAPVSKAWWKAVNRWSTSTTGRHLRRTTRRQLDSNSFIPFIHTELYSPWRWNGSMTK